MRSAGARLRQYVRLRHYTTLQQYQVSLHHPPSLAPEERLHMTQNRGGRLTDRGMRLHNVGHREQPLNMRADICSDRG